MNLQLLLEIPSALYKYYGEVAGVVVQLDLLKFVSRLDLDGLFDLKIYSNPPRLVTSSFHQPNLEIIISCRLRWISFTIPFWWMYQLFLLYSDKLKFTTNRWSTGLCMNAASLLVLVFLYISVTVMGAFSKLWTSDLRPRIISIIWSVALQIKTLGSRDPRDLMCQVVLP